MKHVYEKTHNPDIDPVEWKDFFNVMNEMNEVYPGISSQIRIKLYYNTVRDLPLKAIRDISISFISSQRQMPLPSDFRTAAKEWLKANKVYVHDDKPVPIECNFCNDIGINFIRRIDDKSFYSLMRCDCKTHITQDLKAPTWDNGLRAAYSREACPLDWFKPRDLEEGESLDFKMVLKMGESFKNKKREAELFWKNMGFK